jgi:hypothetical protein
MFGTARAEHIGDGSSDIDDSAFEHVMEPTNVLVPSEERPQKGFRCQRDIW